MNIVISEEYVNTGAAGRVGTSVPVSTPCSMVVEVFAKTTTTAWIEFLALGGDISIVRQDGQPFVNGFQMVDEDITWIVTIDQYRSSNAIQNDILAKVVITLRESELGAVLDQRSVSRFHTGVQC